MFERGRTLLAALATAVVLASPPAGAQVTVASASPQLRALYGAIARGDTAALDRQLSDKLVWTDGVSGAEFSKTRILQLVSAIPRGTGPRTEIDRVRADTIGDIIFANSRRVDHRALGGVDFPTSWRVLDAFARRAGRWELVRHTQTWLVQPVHAIASPDSAALQPFVGRYQAAPGYVDDVHWEHGHLVATITGYPPGARLVPVSATVFSPDGDGALIAFERDSTGRVIGYVQGYPDGRVMRRRKLP